MQKPNVSNWAIATAMFAAGMATGVQAQLADSSGANNRGVTSGYTPTGPTASEWEAYLVAAQNRAHKPWTTTPSVVNTMIGLYAINYRGEISKWVNTTSALGSQVLYEPNMSTGVSPIILSRTAQQCVIAAPTGDGVITTWLLAEADFTCSTKSCSSYPVTVTNRGGYVRSYYYTGTENPCDVAMYYLTR